MPGGLEPSFPILHFLVFFFVASTVFYLERQNLRKLQGLGAPQVQLPSSSWTVNTQGRLGNQMGQYATLYALAKLNGKQALISPKMQKTLGRLFRITLPVLKDRAALPVPWLTYLLDDWMKDDYRHIPWDYVFFMGYPCSWTFYHHLRDEILREFSLHAGLRREAQAFLHRVRQGHGGRGLTFVGVHVRRGDYLRTMSEVWKGVVADKGYLERALAWFRARYANVVFVVVSDGMAWCRRNVDASKGDVVFAEGWRRSAEKDFALLTQCNHTVMTIGTFGFWAAYVAGGHTVYLANYTLPSSKFLLIFRPEAAFLPEWVGIPADLSPLLRNTT
ncbi:galactoside alpha-(1,2)-fucosyltransferase 2-like [Gracilinanus agilis]|uniref:galactoside alpha-(1,2)-fucosyltransferase 2-like n=1 Tax=Gracilinanus agilis TaxID=191870 RepID=UPI001CFD6BA5|nr:galactoside alpha-(1,2)-fucosyltransferase 2-like [Gracilinanus agilis]